MKKKSVEVNVEPPIVAVLPGHDGEFRITQISEIRISPENRKRFNEAALQELAASIKTDGVAQPILIRPVTPTDDQPEIYEIVAGERRYRASKIAGNPTIPTMVRQLSDLQAAKIRILENLQREDPHPLEEAEGYELLMQQHGYNADQLAEEIKKSRSYVYGRLKLCALSLDVRSEFLSDAISASTALLIARIPTPALQRKALDEITKPSGYSAEPMSYRRAAEHIQNRYMLELATAVFAIGDGKLLASVGSCVKCPKRTGNQPEIFADIKSADICTDPDCFDDKRGVHHARLLEQATKKGVPVHEGEARSKFYQNRWSHDSELVSGTEALMHFARNAPATKNGGTPLTLLAADSFPAPDAYLKDDDGAMTPVYKRAKIQEALEKHGFCETVEEHAARMAAPKPLDTFQSTLKQSAKQAEEQRLNDGRRARAAIETEFRISLYRKLRQRGASGFGLASLREFAKLIVRDDNNYIVPDDLIGDVYPFERGTDDAVCAYIDQASLPEVQMIIVDMAIGECLQVDPGEVDHLDNAWNASTFRTLEAMAVHEGISPHMVRLDLKMAKAAISEIGDGEFADFIRVNPGRIEELKEYIIADRPYCLTLLEEAARQNGFQYFQGRFMCPADEAEAVEAIAAQPSVAAIDDDAEQPQEEQADESDTDAEQLAEQMIDIALKPATAKRAKGKTATALSPAAAWPFPKTAAEALAPRITAVAAAIADVTTAPVTAD